MDNGIKYVRVDNEDLTVSSDGNIRVTPGSEVSQVAQSIIGSTARYAIIKNTLHILNSKEISSYALNDPLQPALISTQSIQQGETLFPMNNYLLVGTSSAVLVYGANSTGSLNYISRLDHTTQCDPVVAKGNYAYATLRSAAGCGWGNRSALLVADISNIKDPRQVQNYAMSAPKGLGIAGNKLVVTDGTQGVKIYSLINPASPAYKESIDLKNGNDVLCIDDTHVLITSDQGIHQYNLGGDKPRFISRF